MAERRERGAPSRGPSTVFLDRDGTLNAKPRTGEYVTRAEDFELLPGVAAAVRSLNDRGVMAAVVTNQRGIALGRMSERDLMEIHSRLRVELREAGAHLDAIYHCPHDEDECECRKPGVGLFRRAQEELPSIRFESSAIVGDSWRDVDAGKRLGLTTVLLGGTGGTDELPEADHVAPTLGAAVDRLFAGRPAA